MIEPETTEYKTIYVLEDNDEHYDALRRLLRRTAYAEHPIRRFGNVESFLDHIREDLSPAIVLCDQNLPDSDAQNTSHEVIRMIPDNFVVIAITSQNNDANSSHILQNGAQDYILKTEWTSNSIQRSISNAIDRMMLIEEARRANQELDSFTRMVSHDLKSPLAVILLDTDNVIRSIGKGNHQDAIAHMHSIRDEAKRSTQIIESMLSYARASWNVSELTTVLPEDCASDAKKLALTQLQEEREVKVRISPMDPVIGAETAITQILQNLITNAIKYNSALRPSIHVYQDKAHHDERQVAICVEDNGLGLPPDKHEEVFKLGSRLGHDASGSGLGLAICRRLATLMSGELRIAESTAYGTTFCLVLPRGEFAEFMPSEEFA